MNTGEGSARIGSVGESALQTDEAASTPSPSARSTPFGAAIAEGWEYLAEVLEELQAMKREQHAP